MTKLLLYTFAFLIPLGGILSNVLGFKTAPLILLLLLFLRAIFTKKIIFSKSIFIVFTCFILILLIHFFREMAAIILAGSFIYYLIIGLVFASYTDNETLDLFYVGYIHGVLLVSVLFIGSLFNGGISNSIVDWQYGIPVNISGMGNPNGWSPFLILAIAANDYIRHKKRFNLNSSNIHYLFTLIFLTSLVFTFSRAAIVSVIIYYFIIYRRIIFYKPIFLGSFIAIFLSFFLVLDSFEITSEETGTVASNKEGSIDIRTDVLKAVTTLPWDNVFIGNGYGTSQALIEERIGYPVSLHNVYLATLVELGLVQFFLLLMMCVYPFIFVFNFRKKLKVKMIFYEYILTGIFASLVYWLFHESHINTAFWAIYFCFIQQVNLVKNH